MESPVRNGRREAVARVGLPAPGTRLCDLADLPDPGAREFSFGEGVGTFEMFVVRKGATAYAYMNDCPHTRTPLNWLPDRFLDPTRSLVQCATHGAQFRIEDGFCVSGPCVGASLTPVPIRVEGGAILISGEAG